MNQNFPVHSSQFFTATIYQCPPGWTPVRTGNHLLSDNKHKDIIIDSLKFLVTDKWIDLNAFVVMNNHIHLIWQPLDGFTPSDIQASFMKYTGQQLKRSLIKNDTEALTTYKVNKYDREYPRLTGRAGIMEKWTIEYWIDFWWFVQTKIRILILQSSEGRFVWKTGRLLLFICEILFRWIG